MEQSFINPSISLKLSQVKVTKTIKLSAVFCYFNLFCGMSLLQKLFFFISAIFRKFFYKTLARHFIYSYEAQTQAKPGWHHPSRVFLLFGSKCNLLCVSGYTQPVFEFTLRNFGSYFEKCPKWQKVLYNWTLHVFYGIYRTCILKYISIKNLKEYRKNSAVAQFLKTYELWLHLRRWKVLIKDYYLMIVLGMVCIAKCLFGN